VYLASFAELKNYLGEMEVNPSKELMILVGEKSSQDVEGLINF